MTSTLPSDQDQSGNRSILLVEDDPDIRGLMVMDLESKDVHVTATDNGMSALFEYHRAFQESRPFRVIILDCALGMTLGQPSIDGFTVGMNIRNLERKSEAVPRAFHIYFSGYDEHVHGDLLEEVEADAYFVKPAGPEVIERALEVLRGVM